MPGRVPYYFSAAVEGDVDEIALQRIVQAAGGHVYAVYGKKGKSDLDRKLGGYNSAARFDPWIILRDLNHDAPCAPQLRQTLLPNPAALMSLRIVVRAVEAWLLGDRERIAGFLNVSPSLVPPDPERLENPKQFLVGLAARSGSHDIRRALTPRPGSHRSVGPEYTSRMIEFVARHWRPRIAERRCNSLLRCRQGIAAVIARAR